ncbi:AraC family transcriptional regulator [Streptomyces sp. NPDC050617]|uniref:AraC family transcriptional regulator n=1 Tax=Streptomyces sp. NPDC050617 TaxID=3154628 RepID=UPI00344A51EF
MVKKRHDLSGAQDADIVELAYQAPPGTPAGLEVMTFAELRSRAPEGLLRRPQRLDFHQLLVVRSGSAAHTVDFTGYALVPGSVLWVRPGQVQSFDEASSTDNGTDNGTDSGTDTVDGYVVLAQPGFLPPGTAAAAKAEDPFRPVLWQPVGPDLAAVNRAVDHLAAEFGCGRGLPAEVHTDVLRHLFTVLVLRLAHLTAPVGSSVPAPSETFERFRAAVEREFATSHRVADYARALGYSPRTLSRASLAAAGVGAKEFIDCRVVLEAKRLLAHSELPAARIADRLGFDDAANFSKFFTHRTGLSPGAFRASLKPPSPEPPPHARNTG